MAKLGYNFNISNGMAFAWHNMDRSSSVSYIIPHSGDFNPPFTETNRAQSPQLRIFSYLKTIN